MFNKPSETSYLAATLSAPKPGDFPIGSAQSRAAARFLAGRRKAALIPVMCIQITNTVDIASDNDGAEQGTTNAGGALNPPSLCCELDPMSMGNTAVSWMTRQELVANQRKGDEYITELQVQSDTHRAAATSPEAPSVPQQEQIAVDARRELEMKSGASTEIPRDDEAAREERFKAYMVSRRRPLVRPRTRRFRWPPSAFGE